MRIVRTQHPDLDFDADALNPRLGCAIRWATECLPEDERTKIRTEFCQEVYDAVSADSKECIEILLNMLEPSISFEKLTAIIYGAPKLQLGLPIDAEPTPDVKKRQREFFVSVYQLVCGSDTGPRLPTLFLSVGLDRIRSLLRPVATDMAGAGSCQ